MTKEKKRKSNYELCLETCNKYGYKLLSSIDNFDVRENRIEYECPIHGIRNVPMRSLKEGKMCYECSRIYYTNLRHEKTLKIRQKSHYDKCVKKLSEKNLELISCIDDIINQNTYLTYKCELHGEKTMKVGNIESGKGCPDCAKLKASEYYRLSIDEVVIKVKKCNGNIKNPEEYINQDVKNLSISCPCCGEYFITSLNNFTQHGGQLCDNCTKTKTVGEERIKKYLINNNIEFIQEYWFPDCKDINPLPFDFYLKNRNTIIEFDGSQHFRETHYFGYSYEKTHYHDEIKNEYCKENNINLIRIPYWKINKIEAMLNDKLLHKDIV